MTATEEQLAEWRIIIDDAERAVKDAQDAKIRTYNAAVAALSPYQVGDRVMVKKYGKPDLIEYAVVSAELQWWMGKTPTFSYMGAKLKKDGNVSLAQEHLYIDEIVRKVQS